MSTTKGTRFFFVGGQFQANSDTVPTRAQGLDIFDGRSHTWHHVSAPQSTARAGGLSAQAGALWYLIGGVTNSSSVREPAVDTYDVDEGR